MLNRAAIGSGLVLLAAALAISPLVFQYVVNHNWRTVDEGFLYGSRQMSGPALERAFEDHGIRTVINLRSANAGTDWYDEEVAACAANGVSHANFSWSKNSLPDPESLLAFLDLLKNGEPPFLMHCAGGTHRTGVGAAAYLLDMGLPVERARAEFKLGFNDAPIGDLVALYEGSALPFRQWVVEEYPAKYEAWNAAREAEEAAAGE